MLRAARLAAKLDLTIHADTAAPIPLLAGLLDDVPPARLFDEFLKLFQTGHALASYQRLRDLGLFEHMFPSTAGQLDADPGFVELIERALQSTDKRVAEDRPITPMFLFGVFLWRTVQARQSELIADGECTPTQAMIVAAAEASTAQCQRVALPRRFSLPMREMLQMQLRLENPGGRRARRLPEHKRFRAAYDLLVLRAAVGEVDAQLVTFWDEMQQGHAPAAEADKPARRRRRRRSPRRNGSSSPPAP
jgi:poly(A) polymerase